MQIQKDFIRTRILEAATEEFLLNDYRKASLRIIAEKANITTSNIYRYFNNKAELYTAVVEPAWHSIEQIIAIDKEGFAEKSISSVIMISEEIAKAFIKFKSQFQILLKSDINTPGGNPRDTLLTLVIHHINEDIISCSNESAIDPVIIESMATAICAAMFCILERFDGDEEALIHRLYKTIVLLLGNINTWGEQEGK